MNREKEVYFHQYCKTCKDKNTSEEDAPCRDCLAQPVNTDSHKPVEYKEDK